MNAFLKHILLAIVFSLFSIAYANTSNALVYGDVGDEPYDISDIEDEGEEIDFAASDPAESVNRVIFGFNKGLDNMIFKPVAKLYEFLVPEWGRNRVNSFFYNLHEPVYFVNHALQGDADKASKNVGRFLTNTILGVGGLFDVADEANDDLHQATTDFGLTMRKHGVGMGSYIVIPILGPSTTRDFPGYIADSFMDPWDYMVDNATIITRHSVELVDKRQRKIKLTDQIEDTSLDEYATIRSMYMQKRD